MDDCKAIRWAIEASAPSAAASRVLITLAAAAVDGVADLHQEVIARRSFLKERQTRTILKLLESSEVGLITRERRGGAGKGRFADVYRLSMPETPEKSQPAIFAEAVDLAAATGNMCACGGEQPANYVESERATGNEKGQPADIAAAELATGNSPHTPKSSTNVEEYHILSDPSADERLPEIIPPEKPAAVSGAVWSARLAQAQEICAAAMDPTSTGVRTYTEFRYLCEPSTGIPCDWERDVVPALERIAISFRKKPRTLRSWGFVKEHAVANRDKRLAGLPEPQIFNLEPENEQRNDHARSGQSQIRQRGAGRRDPDSPFAGLRSLTDRVREEERRLWGDGVDQPTVFLAGGA